MPVRASPSRSLDKVPSTRSRDRCTLQEKTEVITAAKPGGEPPMNCEITPIVCAFTTATALSAWSPPRRQGEIPK